MIDTGTAFTVRLDEVGRSDIGLVGGKNASLGELSQALKSAGIRVPAGFAVTVAGYWAFVDANGLREVLARDLSALTAGQATLPDAGRRIREAFLRGAWPASLAFGIREAYRRLCASGEGDGSAVAVRSSATAEDLPQASFAGQQESFLNVRDADALLDACRRCYASLFTDRAIAYREAQGFDHLKVGLSIGVQNMVRSDVGGSGVLFTIDTETGFERTLLINAAWGLGETVVQGVVDPDEYVVFKPMLDDPALEPIIEMRRGEKLRKLVYEEAGTTKEVPTSAEERARFVLSTAEVLTLARWGCDIERHYGVPMDVEWAKDGSSGELFVVQARPETASARRRVHVLRTSHLASRGARLVKGISVGDSVVAGRVCRLESAAEIASFVDGAVLVTSTTDPDWVPIMKRAAALVTDHGGRTSHAAIVSRELGLPAVVGTGDATSVLRDGQDVTVSCGEGDEGFVYEGLAKIRTQEVDLTQVPVTHVPVMLNLANPAAALRWWVLPADGVGLARMEFVIANHIRVHPMALLHPERVADPATRRAIDEQTLGYADKAEYFVDRLSRGLARIAAVAHPYPVIVRLSDFKTNEYANLLGGKDFEGTEENPMLGLRGASRYYAPSYREAFALECRAIKRLREHLGFRNVLVMVPFCRTPREADLVLELLTSHGLERGVGGLQVYVMCEIPSNVILAREFARRFDGFSIGSNDLTQLTLGVDRDSEQLATLFDERDEAVRWMIRRVISEAHAVGSKVGFCGQAPSNDPAFAAFLVECGIDSVSVTPDAFLAVKRAIAVSEAALSTSTEARRAGQT